MERNMKHAAVRSIPAGFVSRGGAWGVLTLEDDLAFGDFEKAGLVDAQLLEYLVAAVVVAEEHCVEKVGGINDAASELGEVLGVSEGNGRASCRERVEISVG